jgi:hypothetical protein
LRSIISLSYRSLYCLFVHNLSFIYLPHSEIASSSYKLSITSHSRNTLLTNFKLLITLYLMNTYVDKLQFGYLIDHCVDKLESINCFSISYCSSCNCIILLQFMNYRSLQTINHFSISRGHYIVKLQSLFLSLTMYRIGNIHIYQKYINIYIYISFIIWYIYYNLLLHFSED